MVKEKFYMTWYFIGKRCKKKLKVGKKMILCYLLCYFQLVFGEGFSPNVRYHAPQANASFNYSYVNLKYLKGHKLDITPLFAITVRNRTHCVRKCLATKGVCQSINTEKINEVSWDCEILPSDVYNNAGKLISHPEVVHSVIAVSHENV